MRSGTNVMALSRVARSACSTWWTRWAGGYGAVLLVARPEADPVPGLRERDEDVRLPGDR